MRPRLNVKGVDKAEKATLKAGLDEDAACTLALAVAADGLLSWLRTESGAVSRGKVNGAFVAMAHGVLLRGDRARAPIPSAATLDRVQSRQSRQADAPASQPEDPAAPAPPPQGPAAPPVQAPPPQPAPAPAPPPGPPANTPATPPAQRPLFSGFGTRSHHTAALSLALKLLPAQAFQHDKLPSCRSVRVWGAWGGGCGVHGVEGGCGWVCRPSVCLATPPSPPLPPPPHPPTLAHHSLSPSTEPRPASSVGCQRFTLRPCPRGQAPCTFTVPWCPWAWGRVALAQQPTAYSRSCLRRRWLTGFAVPSSLQPLGGAPAQCG